MLYARGDLRYMAIVAPSLHQMICDHIQEHKDYHNLTDKWGRRMFPNTKPARFETWEWCLETGVREAYDGQVLPAFHRKLASTRKV